MFASPEDTRHPLAFVLFLLFIFSFLCCRGRYFPARNILPLVYLHLPFVSRVLFLFLLLFILLHFPVCLCGPDSLSPSPPQGPDPAAYHDTAGTGPGTDQGHTRGAPATRFRPGAAAVSDGVTSLTCITPVAGTATPRTQTANSTRSGWRDWTRSLGIAACAPAHTHRVKTLSGILLHFVRQTAQ